MLVATGTPGQMSLAFDKDLTAVVGVAQPTNAVQRWTGNAWQPVSPLRPQGSLRASAAYHAGRGVTVVLEVPAFPTAGHTWEWDGRSWRRSAVTPSALNGTQSALAYDAACQHVVGFGGSAASETWLYKTGWQSIGSGTQPAPRNAHAMTYDAAREAIVVYGGNSEQVVWQLEGPCDAKEWKVYSATGPGPRAGTELVYDPVRKVSVLFGGGPTPSDDTWEWDGSVWRQVMTATRPPPRLHHAMAFDPRSRTIVMHGGIAGTERYSDTWHYDGTDWTKLPVLVAPEPPRSEMPMTIDVTGSLVMFGGNSQAPSSNLDVTRLRAESTETPLEPCALADDDRDVDGLKGCADPDCGLRCKPDCLLGDPTCTESRCGDDTCESPREDYLLCPECTPTSSRPASSSR